MQVTNTNKDTSLKWFKEGSAVTQAVYDQSSGVSTLTITQVSTPATRGREGGLKQIWISIGQTVDVWISQQDLTMYYFEIIPDSAGNDF